VIALLGKPVVRAVGAIVVIGAAFTAVYVKGRSDAAASIQRKLSEARIQVLKDGQEIDNAVELATDDGLCALLGGCGVHDDTEGD